MEIIPLTMDNYALWDKFCLASDDAWFWHNSQWLEYSLNYAPALESKSISFLIKDDHDILAICPLFIENSIIENGALEFSFGGGFLPRPAFLNSLKPGRRSKVEEFTFSYINNLALKHNVKRAQFRDTPTRKCFFNQTPPPINPLIKHGLLDCSEATCIIDLKRDVDELYNSIRRGHQRDMKHFVNGNKNVIKSYYRDSVTREIFEEYREMHHRTAGRVTRPKITFDMMYDMAVSGNAILFTLADETKNRIYLFILLYKDTAYPGSIADDPEYTSRIRGSHVLLHWEVMKYLKANGVLLYETGSQVFGPQTYSTTSPKLEAISRFLRGFGGYFVPLYRAEKYYDLDFFKKVYSKRIEEYCMPRLPETIV